MYEVYSMDFYENDFGFGTEQNPSNEYNSADEAIVNYLKLKCDATCKCISAKTRQEALELVTCFVANFGKYKKVATEAGYNEGYIKYLHREAIKKVNNKVDRFKDSEYYEQVDPFSLG